MVHYFLIEEDLKKKKVLLEDIGKERDCCLGMLTTSKEILEDLEKIREVQQRDLEVTNKKN